MTSNMQDNMHRQVVCRLGETDGARYKVEGFYRSLVAPPKKGVGISFFYSRSQVETKTSIHLY